MASSGFGYGLLNGGIFKKVSTFFLSNPESPDSKSVQGCKFFYLI
jgi:hypothetical protein